MTSPDDSTSQLGAADLLRLPHDELWRRAIAANLSPPPGLARDELAALLLQHALDRGERCSGEGLLSVLPEGYGFLRQWSHDLAPSAVDPFVSPSQIRSLQLRPGQQVRGAMRGPRGGERCFALANVDVAALPPAATAPFASRSALVPTRALRLPDATPQAHELAMCAPWRHGHRVLVRGPADFAAAPWLAQLGAWIADAAPSTAVLLCLLDARPDQVAAARAMLAQRDVQVAAVDFGAAPTQQLTTAELIEQAAQRLVEQGRDVVLLLDSLDALARAHQRSRPASGVWAHPGLDAPALQVTRRWLAAARQLDGGGALTVIAHATGEGSVGAALLAELSPFGNSEVVVMAGNDGVQLDLTATRTRPEAH